QPRRIAIILDGEALQELTIPADQADVLRQVDLSGRIATTPGTHQIKLEDRSGTDSSYQVVFRYHEPDTGGRTDSKAGPAGGPFTARQPPDAHAGAPHEPRPPPRGGVHHPPRAAPEGAPRPADPRRVRSRRG